MQNFDFAQI